MTRKVKINKVENGIVILRNGDKWKLKRSLDEAKVKRWSMFDEIELETIGLDKGFTNTTRNEMVKAEPV